MPEEERGTESDYWMDGVKSLDYTHLHPLRLARS